MELAAKKALLNKGVPSSALSFFTLKLNGRPIEDARAGPQTHGATLRATWAGLRGGARSQDEEPFPVHTHQTPQATRN